MNNSIFSRYLSFFLENQFGNLEKIAAKITDIEPELLTDFAEDKNSQFTIVVVKEDDFAKAVEIRNNPQIVKIILLSVGNADFIDSLKDFEPYSIVPEKFEDFKSIIESAFYIVFDREQSNYLEIIFSDKKDSLAIFLEYIQKSIENGKISNKLLNQNLNLLQYWKIASVKLSVSELKILMKNSSIPKVERQMKNSYKNNEDFKKISGFKEIADCILQGNYSEMLNYVYWEDVKEFLVTKNAKINTEFEEREESKIYSNSFEYLLDNLDKFNGIQELEANMQVDTENYEDFFCDYKSTYKEVAFFDEIQNKLSSFILSDDKKNTLLNSVNRLNDSYTVFCESNVTPKELNLFCDKSTDYLKNYLSLMCLVITDSRISKCFNQYSLVESLQRFNMKDSDGVKEIDYGHPISIFFFHNLRRHYNNGLRSVNKETINSYKHFKTLQLIHKYLPTWPTEYFIFNNNKHVVTGFLNQPIGQPMLQPVSDASSPEAIDFRPIAKIITEFCYRNTTLNEYNIALVGTPRVQNMQAFFESVSNLFRDNDLLISKITIRFICTDESQIKNSIANIYKNGSFSEKIFFRFCKVDKWQENNWDDDLILFLDASMLYEREKFVKIYNDKNAIAGQINKAVKEPDLDTFSNDESKLLKIVWDTLQNIAIENSSDLVIWQKSEIRNFILDKIIRTIKNSEKEVCVLTKNMNLLEAINLPTIQTEKKIVSVGRKNLLKVMFSKSKKHKDNSDDSAVVWIDFIQFMVENGTKLPLETDGFSHLQSLKFKLEGSSMKLIYKSDDLNNTSQVESDLEIIFNGTTFIEKCYRKDFIQFIRNATCNVNQMALCYIIENYCPEKMKLEISIEISQELKPKTTTSFDTYAAQIIFDKVFNGIGTHDEPDEWNIEMIKEIYKGVLEFPDIYSVFHEKMVAFFNKLKDRGVEFE